jgi:hypothetical protein
VYLAKELIAVLEKAKQTGEYFNPFIIQGVIGGIQDGCPEADEIITDDLSKWASNMLSR